MPRGPARALGTPDAQPDRGLAVILISHNMTDVLQVADSIAVLYLGRTAAQVPRKGLNQQELVELITTGGSTAHLDQTNGATA